MLTDAKLIMLFKRVGTLDDQRRFVGEALGWPVIETGPSGDDPNVTMYDAGGAIVGFSVQRAVNDANSCSVESLQPIDLSINPASALTISPLDFGEAIQRLERLRPSARRAAERGATLRFLDDFGNQMALRRQVEDGEAELNDKRRRLLEQQRAAGLTAAVTEVTLQVSDLAESARFYGETLGLRSLGQNRTSANYDVGSLVLTLEQEFAVGMVGQLSAAGRLREDWLVFHVEELEPAMAALGERGIAFPGGVEEWDNGRQAYFNDPDGHYLCVWQPANTPTNYDFYPQVRRILGAAA